MKRQRESLVGQRIADLFVEKMLGVDNRNATVYLCRCCLCGRAIIVKTDQLKKHQIKNCGCKPTIRNNGDDLKGKRFGALTVKEYLGRKNHSSLWRCVCNCGRETTVSRSSLISGDTKSCGCKIHQLQKNDLTGKRFGRLVVVERTKKNNKTAWKCQCDCGNVITTFARCLNSGNTKSCGCLKYEKH